MVDVRLLGDLEVEAGGKRIDPPASRRAWSLLAWLALHPGEHPRSAVAAAFWPDVLDSSARASLRSAAWALRRALGPAADGALTGGRDRIGLFQSFPAVSVHTPGSGWPVEAVRRRG